MISIWAFFILAPRIDCEWGEYGRWTDCSQSCGNGLKFRTRSIVQEAQNEGKQCLGCEQEIGVCNLSECLSKGIIDNNRTAIINGVAESKKSNNIAVIVDRNLAHF